MAHQRNNDCCRRTPSKLCLMWMQTLSTGKRKESTYRKLVDNGSSQASLKTARTNVSTADRYFPEILAIQNIVVEIIL
jgi:hypothetical protein